MTIEVFFCGQVDLLDLAHLSTSLMRMNTCAILLDFGDTTMSPSLDKRVNVKLLVGFVIHPEMRREMFTSDKWHMAQIAWKSQENGLEIVPNDGKKYIGKYLDSSFLTTKELIDIESKIRKQLVYHCPAVDQYPLKFFIFPQIFVS